MVGKKVTAFDVVLVVIMVLLSAIFLYPLLNMLALSFSDSQELKSLPVYLWPKGFSLESYKALLGDSRTLLYYWNTVKYASVGTVIMLLTTSLMAYPLSIPALRGRRFVSVLLTITMFFGGGLIPYYVTIMQLGMINTFWVMVIPGAISAYNVIVFKTFFMSIPEALRESASLDGAGHVRILFQIVLPLSKAIIAVVALYSAVSNWNEWYVGQAFVTRSELWPLQTVMLQVIKSQEMKFAGLSSSIVNKQSKVTPEAVRMAMIVVCVVPILFVYPFLQRYFIHGIMIGAVKE